MKSLILSIFVTCFAVGCFSEATPAVAQAPNEQEQRKPSDSLLSLFSKPRFAVIYLTEGEDLQKQLSEAIHARNFEELLIKYPVAPEGSLEEQNAGLVLRMHTLSLQTELDWKQLNQRASAESRSMSPEEHDLGLSNHLRRMKEITEGFRRLSRQGLMEGTLNHFAMLHIIKQTADSMGDWNGSYGANIDVARLGSSKKVLRGEVEQLVALLEVEDKVSNAVGELSRQNHWPAIETAIRHAIQAGKGPDAIQDLVDRLAECKGLDAHAYDYLARSQFHLALSQTRTPPKSVPRFARLAVDGGVLSAYGTLYDYHHSQGELTQARKIIEEGTTAGQRECIFKLGCLKFVDNEYLAAEKLLSQALAAGVADATVLLGIIYETGGGGVRQDAAKALEYFHQGLAANVPEATEKIGLLYFNGTLNAEIPKLDYQIPGVPRLPEPTHAEKQRIANYIHASIYMSSAAKLYAERGDTVASERARNISKIVEKAAYELNAQAMTGAVSPNWTAEDDYRLNRSFERQIENRDQMRRETEERNRRYDRAFNGY